MANQPIKAKTAVDNPDNTRFWSLGKRISTPTFFTRLFKKTVLYHGQKFALNSFIAITIDKRRNVLYSNLFLTVNNSDDIILTMIFFS